MKRAFHGLPRFSQRLVVNSSASHYAEFPRERTLHKVPSPAAAFKYAGAYGDRGRIGGGASQPEFDAVGRKRAALSFHN